MEKGSYFQEFEFRPRPMPSGDMPLGLKGAGHFRCEKGPLTQPDFSAHIWVAWCTGGQLKAVLEDEEVTIKPNQSLIVMPDTSCHILVNRNCAEFFWCSIDGPDAADIAMKLGIETGVFNAGEPPKELITEWISKLPSQSDRVERELSAAAYELLYRLAKDIKTKNTDPVFTDIQNYILKNIQNSDLTIDSIAENFGLHRSTLANMFKKNTGQSAKDYVTTKRLNKAEQLLMSTGEKISDISLQCGFSDPNYFSRMFRKIRGMTPREYREALSVK